MSRTVAFYAPLKPPGHPIPSGDREVARNLIKALRLGGYDVVLPTEVISYQKRPSAELFMERKTSCEAEAARLIQGWTHGAAVRPDLWFTYHPYCKSPDWIGPGVAHALSIPYVTAEACRTRQGTDADWREARAAVQVAIRQAAVNFCLKPSDRAYLESFLPDMDSVVPLAPFFDQTSIGAAGQDQRGGSCPGILAVGMMRPGAKVESYRLLAEALAGLTDLDWRLVVIGDGPERETVEGMFAFAAGRVAFAGALPREQVFAEMARADVFTWPGVREAFGMVYLEAQAAGLPVVAFRTAGVPIVVAHGEGGLLAPEGDVRAFRADLARLLASPDERRHLGAAARERVVSRHGLAAAAATIGGALRPLIGQDTGG